PAADEDHQRGGVHRLHIHRPGYPSPAASDRDPAAVVEGSVAPGIVVDPGPSPGIDPGPMADVIGRPTNFNPIGEPDVAVSGIVAPIAVFIEIVEAHYIGREILCRPRVIVAVIAGFDPGIKLVGFSNRVDLAVE